MTDLEASSPETSPSKEDAQSLNAIKRLMVSLELALAANDTPAIHGHMARIILWIEDTDLYTTSIPKEILQRLSQSALESLATLDEAMQKSSKEALNKINRVLRQTSPPHVIDAPPPLVHRTTEQQSKRKVLLVEDDALVLKHLVFQFETQGFQIVAQQGLDHLDQLILQEMPDVIIMDIMLQEGLAAGPEFMINFRENHEPPPPTIFVSARDDFEARLMAVRGGADAYLSKPFDFSELLDLIDETAPPTDPEPYRIFAVDDDNLILRFIRHSLERNGLLVETTTEPHKVVEQIYDFKPDVLISDINMPNCNGLELAGVIRQLKSFHSMPIIFLSAEASERFHSSSLYKSGDMFVSKPVDPEYLARLARNRASRSRTMRTLMFEDSLTGLLNHMTTRENLRREIARAYRNNEDLTIAMVDIDHFKRVNDTYGHPTGDRVLKSFARFLKTRLRRTDIIGRYGSEEFIIIMPNTHLKTGQRIVDELRENFCSVTHECDQDRFKVTFSSGMASFPPHMDINQIIDKADMALYDAKKSGRNRVVVAD